ncbi:HTH-type transcriptional regulator McbR [Roseovarius sp. THAF27]|uniref:GntR family transcriptional regulator n=1 Tax=unclassified Roseovarius TaxID=2614913 RepID=UPI001267C04A|nr:MULTISPECIES: GntR family transcriptional regulator [unclassified Roseovarius]QFT82448.1 HTH-type transcriptional regulator McbR [Roseovarius sp. THAF27]QFT98519.1 HTH-type transcriptional regulator McbR [Roseovarius sp. THAF8]
MERKRADLIADAIEELILDGTFDDGARLDEVQLAERFNVSRTPIREALQRLILSGLVEQLPRRGVFVRQPGPVELIEMFEVMAELEAVCARLAASRISDTALSELRTINERCRAATEAQDADGNYDQNDLFHATLYAQTGNAFLEQECLRLQRRLRPFRRLQLRWRGRMAQSVAEHDAILAAIEAGDGDQAGNLLRQHVTVQGEKFHRLMSSLKAAAE